MTGAALIRKTFFFLAALLAATLGSYPSAQADPSRYPEFAQQ